MYKLIANVCIRKQDVNGNTYHDVTIIDPTDGCKIAYVKKVYGYGSAYHQTITALINQGRFLGTNVISDDNMRAATLIIVHDHMGKITLIGNY